MFAPNRICLNTSWPACFVGKQGHQIDNLSSASSHSDENLDSHIVWKSKTNILFIPMHQVIGNVVGTFAHVHISESDRSKSSQFDEADEFKVPVAVLKNSDTTTIQIIPIIYEGISSFWIKKKLGETHTHTRMAVIVYTNKMSATSVQIIKNGYGLTYK